VAFTYTPSGRRETATDARGVTSWTYDDRDRLESLTYPDGRALTYGHDANSNRTSLTATIAGAPVLTTGYTYDDANRLDIVTDTAGRTYDHGYDANGNRTSLAQPNGTVTAYTYDTLNRLTNLTTVHGATTVQSYALTLGLAGNRTQITEGDGTVRAYGYDELYRLTSDTVTIAGLSQYAKAFVYDDVGNRQTQTTAIGPAGAVIPGVLVNGAQAYTYDERDRLTSETLGANPPTTYGWDADGNLTTKSAEATYAWDRENRLVRVTKTDGTIVENAYDFDGTRVRTVTTPSGGSPSATSFLVDTSGSLSQVVAETDAAGALVVHYVRGDDLLALMRPNGSGGWVSRFYHADHIGSVRRLTDETGAITDGYTYTAFGELLGHSGTDPQPYAFTGEPYDPNVGFQYHRARWMDPRAGRFVSEDAFVGNRFDPPSLHKYLYAHGSTQNRTDPSGLLSAGEALTALTALGVVLNVAQLGMNLRRYYASDSVDEKLAILPSIWMNTLGIALAFLPGVGPGGSAAASAGSATVSGAEVLLTIQKVRAIGSVVVPVGQGLAAIGVLFAKNNRHTAEWQVRDASGEVKAYGSDTSGGTSPGRRLTWPEQLLTHSERRILEQIRLIAEPGDTVLIYGTKAPCSPGGSGCQSAMADAARELRINIIYQQEGGVFPWFFKP
jgi:RHS repeat-associated protein